VIVPAGGKERAFMAFDQATGRPIWNARTNGGAYVSPMIINSGGQDQVIGVTATHIVSIDPKSSNVL
jgi:hypothetical protein